MSPFLYNFFILFRKTIKNPIARRISPGGKSFGLVREKINTFLLNENMYSEKNDTPILLDLSGKLNIRYLIIQRNTSINIISDDLVLVNIEI